MDAYVVDFISVLEIVTVTDEIDDYGDYDIADFDFGIKSVDVIKDVEVDIFSKHNVFLNKSSTLISFLLYFIASWAHALLS